MQATAGLLALSSMCLTGSDSWLQGIVHRRQASNPCSAIVRPLASGQEWPLLGRKLPTIKGCYRSGAVGEQNNGKLLAILGLL